VEKAENLSMSSHKSPSKTPFLPLPPAGGRWVCLRAQKHCQQEKKGGDSHSEEEKGEGKGKLAVDKVYKNMGRSRETRGFRM